MPERAGDTPTHECDENGTFCRGCDLDTLTEPRRDDPMEPLAASRSDVELER